MKDTAQKRLIDSLTIALGDVIMCALADSKTVEILLNEDGQVWQERLGEGLKPITTLTHQNALYIINQIAGMLDKTITRENPLIECELPIDGSRFAGQIPPVVSAPTFAIRKKASAIFRLEEYVANGIMEQRHKEFIVEQVRAHKNILIIGGTGSGKTTLVNSIIQEIVDQDPSERICIIEDTGEIQCSAVNKVQYHTTLEISMTMLLKTILRMRPDRVLVGEVRGAEALDLLDAWNTGHEGGVATLHANDAHAALVRLKSLITRNPCSPDLIEPLIGEVVHCIVHIARTPEGRKVKEVIRINGYKDGIYDITVV